MIIEMLHFLSRHYSSFCWCFILVAFCMIASFSFFWGRPGVLLWLLSFFLKSVGNVSRPQAKQIIWSRIRKYRIHWFVIAHRWLKSKTTQKCTTLETWCIVYSCYDSMIPNTRANSVVQFWKISVENPQTFANFAEQGNSVKLILREASEIWRCYERYEVRNAKCVFLRTVKIFWSRVITLLLLKKVGNLYHAENFLACSTHL